MPDTNLAGTQTIETERLILRRFAPDDAEPMYRNWACDPEVTRFLTWGAHPDIDVTRRVLQSWVEAYSDGATLTWAIVPKELGQPVGSIALMNLSTEHSRAEVGYCIGRPWWGRGITAEALRAVLKYAFEVVGLNRVEAHHNVNNPGSGAVMRKAGMSYEGRFRQWKRADGRFDDYDFYAMLMKDYNEGSGRE